MVHLIERFSNYQMLYRMLNVSKWHKNKQEGKKKEQSKSHSSDGFCVSQPPPAGLALSLSLTKQENTTERCRDTFARAAFAATQLVAEQWADQKSKWHSWGTPTWSVAPNGVGQFGFGGGRGRPLSSQTSGRWERNVARCWDGRFLMEW